MLPLVVTPSENCASFGMASAVPVPFTVMPCSGGLFRSARRLGDAYARDSGRSQHEQGPTAAIRIIFIVAS